MRVGVGQIALRMGNKDANLAAVTDAIEAAAERGCDVVVLPECPLAGWLSPLARDAAEPVPGPFIELLAQLARSFGLAVVSGVEEVHGDHLHNAAVLLDRHGQLLTRHRKINELQEGLQVYRRGRSLAVVDLDGVPVGINICADSWVPSITDTLHLMGAKVVFSPCAWATNVGQEQRNLAWIRRQYASRTANKQLWIVAANSVGRVPDGPWRGKILHGNSLVTGPDGDTIARGGTNQVGLVIADLPLS